MFALPSRIVQAGLLLTLISRVRPVTAEESRGLEEEELHLQPVFEQWMPFFARPPSGPDVKIEFVGAGAAEDAEIGVDEKSERVGDSDGREHMSDEQATPTDARLHAAIVAHLKDMQSNLADLLTRWRNSSPCKPEGEDDNASGPPGKPRSNHGRFPLDAFGDGEMVREKTEADTIGTESKPSDRAGSFWSSSSLTRLAGAQGTAPVGDLGALAALWPSDDDPDELLAHVLADRSERRRAAGGSPDR